MSAAGTGVLVLGMHRSGTSATTRAINLLGVPVAREEELKAASPNNPTGFWEVTRLTELNNALLADLGGSSLAPPLLEPGWERRLELERRRKRARRLVARTHDTDDWVWKDPRNCVLLPFWREALAARIVGVLVHREPCEVANSLEARQGLSAAMSFATWERYMREALAGTSGMPVYVTRYADLVSDPAAWARQVGAFLRAEGVPCNPEEGAPQVADLVASGRPGAAAGAQAEPGTGAAGGIRAETRTGTEPGTGGAEADAAAGWKPSHQQLALVEVLESLAGPHTALEPPELPPETSWTEPLLAERRRADVMRGQMEERLNATRRRLRAVQAGEGDAEELPKQGRAGSGRAPSGRAGSGGAGSGCAGSGRQPAPEGRLALRRRLRRMRAAGRENGDSGGVAPDYLIIGAQKCGTSSLFRYLGESPHVELPTEKEIHFFDNKFDRGLDWYRAHFPKPKGGRRRMTGEASPYYLFHPLAPRRIREALPDVRLLALVRNPVHRAVSHYYHELGNGFEDLPLAAALDREEERLAGEAERIEAEPGYSSFNHRHFSYKARGVYVDQLTLWRSIFPEEQLLVINSDSLFERTDVEMRRVYEFLGLPGRPPRELGAYNRRDYPQIAADVEARLADHFAPHNARLYELLGEDLGWEADRAR